MRSGDEALAFQPIEHDNPKDIVGSKKLTFSAMPWEVISELALGLSEGARKYGRYNYQHIGVRSSIYFDATMRHLTAWFLGEDIDPDSGIHHITKAMTSLAVLRSAQMHGKCTDDRPVEFDSNVAEQFSKLLNRVEDCGNHYDKSSLKARSTNEQV